MARGKRRDIGQEAVATSAPDAPARPSRFRVRCVDPTLRGHSVRGVVIPQGGSVVVDLSEPAYALPEALADRAVVVEEVP